MNKIKALLFLYIFLNLSFAQKLIVQGLQTLDINTVNGIFSLSNFDASLKKLYNLNTFAKIDLIKKNNQTFVLKLKEYPKITKIQIKGCKHISQDKILSAIFPNYQTSNEDENENKKFPSFYLSFSKYKKIKKAIEKLYRKNGYVNPKITFKLLPNKDNTYTLIIKIDEGKRFWVKNIFIKGNKALSDWDIKKVLLNKDQAILLLRFHPPLVKDYFPQEIKNIEDLYKSHGYLEVKVKKQPIVSCDIDGACNITYIIEKEGPRYRFGNITIVGLKYFYPKDILKKVKELRTGKPFNYKAIEKFKYLLRQFYYKYGFYNAKIIDEIKIDKKNKLVNVKIICVPGKRYFINRIKIKGNYETRDWTLRRELDLKEKYIFTPEELARSIRRIYALGFIEKVNPKIKPIDNNTLNVTLKVKERAFGNLRLGAAWNTVNGLYARASINRANLRGTGDTVDFSVEAGKKILYFDLTYKHYFLFDKPINVLFDLYHKRDVYTDYTSIKTGFSTTFEERWKKDFYFSQGFTLTRNSIKGSSNVNIQNGTSKYFIFTPGIKYNTLDNPYLPHTGTYAKLYTNVGYDFSNSSVGGFFSTNFELVRYWNLNDYFYNYNVPIIFMEKLTTGICTTDTPVDYKFHLGGEESIRGYDYGEIGIFNKMWVNTCELGYDFTDGLRGVVFLDLGGKDFKNIYGGYGFGIRMLSPLGPILFDFGWKLKPVEGESKFNFHFGISSYF